MYLLLTCSCMYIHVYAYGSKTVLIKRTFLLTGCRGLCWGGVGGVGWGGGVNVLSSAYSKCCYAAEISGMLATLLRCRDLWNKYKKLLQKTADMLQKLE